MKITDRHAAPDAEPLSVQAAYWWVVLNDADCTAADRATFAGWVGRSPEHIETFLRASMLHGALHGAAVRWPDTPAGELIREALTSRGEVIASGRFPAVAARPHDSSSSRSLRMLFFGSLAAMLIAAVAVAAFASRHEYSTRLGEQRSVVLEDGSIVSLNTSSVIEVAFGERQRLIRLKRGEALFQVAHDAARPFDVVAGSVTIRAVGTQFNVDRRADHTTVTVVEGKVQVSAAAQSGSPESAAGGNVPHLEELAAAQRLIVTGTLLSAPEPVRNVPPVTAWTQRKLMFENRPIQEVAEEFNRYNREHILIGSPALKAQRVTGVFQANDPASFLAFVAGIPGVSIQTTREGHHEVTLNRGVEKFDAAGGPN